MYHSQQQGRWTFHLSCGHILSVPLHLVVEPYPVVGELANCGFCPDPAPEELRLVKSATQLWKEAGEP